MKRVRCPKCDNYLTFDETQYSEGQSLVFVCDACGKQFSIRIGKSKLNATNKDRKKEEEVESEFGTLTVVENIFGYKQILPLQEGDNIIGRRCVGTVINSPIESGDMSMDRRHCILNVRRKKDGTLVYTLQDGPSLTGTFVHNELLQKKERRILDDEAIITLGATTLILHKGK
ncbi:MAG: FHA domain-containing protein [Bacteroides sp.]|nr:FHA domain-containing protein [Bacteroides sp.]